MAAQIPPRALVIDDDEIARELLTSLLEMARWEVYQLPSPIGATKLIIDRRIHVVVADVMMPDITGDKMVRLLRGNSRSANVGIVLVSASGAELERLRSEIQIDAVVHKKDARTELVRVAQRVYQSRPRNAGGAQ